MSNKFVCQRPFDSIVFGTHGVSSCYCYYGPTLGLSDLTENQSPLAHSKITTLREYVSKGDYSLCNKDCLIIKKGDEFTKDLDQKYFVNYDGATIPFQEQDHQLKEVTMALEDGCNLSCPSCRVSIRGNTLSQKEIEFGWTFLHNNLRDLELVSLGGSGEPFTHKEVLSFLANTDEKLAPNLKTVSIITNGTLLNSSMWDRISPYLKSKIEILVSIDGASKETYEANRRGAQYAKVMSNLKFISNQNLKRYTLLAVLQNNNFTEIPNFIKLAESLDAGLNLYALRNWGTYTEQNFIGRNVFDSQHPNNKKLLQLLNDVSSNHPNVRLDF